jgi:hypothetical protein
MDDEMRLGDRQFASVTSSDKERWREMERQSDRYEDLDRTDGWVGVLAVGTSIVAIVMFSKAKKETKGKADERRRVDS